MNGILRHFGYEMRRAEACDSGAFLSAALRRLIRNGLRPATVVDVGVATGTKELYAAFPGARHILVEPLEEFQQDLEAIVAGLENAEYVMAVATSSPGLATINVHADLHGSSVLMEGEDGVNGVRRKVRACTLSEICRERKTVGPYLLKIDTQGSELDVVSGAEQILQEVECVIMEVSLFAFFEGGPQIGDCISFMQDRGFVPYDIVGLQYRLLDGAMSQADVVFVRSDGPLRACHAYATPQQRREQDRQFTTHTE